MLPYQLFRLAYRPTHSLIPRRKYNFSTKCLQQAPALKAHGLWHGDKQLVTFGGTGERQPNSGIAAGRLNDDRSRFDFAALFTILDHGHANSVFHRPQRVEVFQLPQNNRLGTICYPPQLDQRGIANTFCDAVINFATTGS